ncbi:MAG: Mrp/NBP35 family ATP-binding protein [Candidatus Marinimicrobia bacterium]|nr:Mrp/NBP35 family ATP-binding protein [Candidatus Neomarinimicrobiota bacterium]
MNKEQVMDILKTVNYPGFTRNLVDFGMVRDIEKSSEGWIIRLNVVSKDEKKLDTLRKQVIESLAKKGEKTAHVLIDTKPAQIKGQKPSGQAKDKNPFDDQKRFEYADHVIAVASGKGGVGKSTIAANLAMAMAKQGKSVGLMDLDVYGPSVPTLFGVVQPPRVEDEHTIYPAEKYGIQIMSFGFFIEQDSPVIWRGPLVMKLVTQFLNDVVWKPMDFLILDLPPGTGDVQLSLVQQLKLDGAVIVTTPQDLALADVKRGANMFGKVNTPVLGIVENMSYFVCPHCGKESYIFSKGGGDRESRRLNVPLLGRIPLTEDVMNASDTGCPIVESAPDSEPAKNFSGIATSLIKMLQK